MIRISVLGLISFFLLQCDAKPRESSIRANSGGENYKELKELIKSSKSLNESVSFVAAAAISTPCVVHIKTKVNIAVQSQHPLSSFFGHNFNTQPHIQKRESSGSGVIIGEDGYIVTNFHVIQNASEIEVTLRNKNTYKAKVIGTDKDTDIALIKIEESKLPAMEIANSDKVMVGEWVLAVGNPFNLESTVTQGIVSAKGRSLNVGRSGAQPIESFIQTDAAVNPGNSGGALVNLNGELIGINTAIASPTGAYAGYAFAVPSNLVQKVISDLKQYGTVQRAYLGINASQLTSDIAKKLALPSPTGVLIRDVFQGSAADAAGLRPNDVILKLNNHDISSFPELLEHINTLSPGDKVAIFYHRNGKTEIANTILKNRNNSTEIIELKDDFQKKLGIEVQPLSNAEYRRYQINSGLRVSKLNRGLITERTDLKPGFIILSINEEDVQTENDLSRILSRSIGSTIIIEGFYPNKPYTFQYAFKLS